MTLHDVSPEMLRDAVHELVEECRRALREGKVDASEVDRGVRAYCDALTRMPREEGRRHAPDLEAMMKLVTGLRDDLVAASSAVQVELQALDRLRRANVAYQKSDGVVGMHKKSGGGS